jgi:hypothetical protein
VAILVHRVKHVCRYRNPAAEPKEKESIPPGWRSLSSPFQPPISKVLLRSSPHPPYHPKHNLCQARQASQPASPHPAQAAGAKFHRPLRRRVGDMVLCDEEGLHDAGPCASAACITHRAPVYQPSPSPRPSRGVGGDAELCCATSATSLGGDGPLLWSAEKHEGEDFLVT